LIVLFWSNVFVGVGGGGESLSQYRLLLSKGPLKIWKRIFFNVLIWVNITEAKQRIRTSFPNDTKEYFKMLSKHTIHSHMDMAKNLVILFYKWTLAILSACFETQKSKISQSFVNFFASYEGFCSGFHSFFM